MVIGVNTSVDNSVAPLEDVDRIVPPHVNKYDYQIDFTTSVTEDQIYAMSSRIGSSIKFHRYTSLQIEKIKIIFNYSLGVIAGAVLFIENVFPVIGMMCMSASLVIGIWSIGHRFSMYDLDSTKERTSLSKKIHTWDFKKITDTFKSDELISYDVMRDLLCACNENQKARIYANISNLYADKALLDKKQKEILETVSKVYDVGVEALRKYYPLRWVLSSGYGGGMELNRERDYKYYEVLSLWEDWSRKEKVNIKEAYNKVMDRLNIDYTRYLQEIDPSEIFQK